MNEIPLRQRAIAAYLGLAVGDALGATTEFMTPSEIQHKYTEHKDIIGGGWLRLKPGCVTDDTEMSLALGSSILQNKAVIPEKVAESFSDWMRGKPVDIGNTVRRGIINYRTTGKPQVPVNEYDAGNGACMRCLPVALFYHDDIEGKMIHASRLQSRVTHNNRISDAGTETLLAMLVCALHDGTIGDLSVYTERLVKKHRVFRFEQKPVTNPSGWIVETLQVVFQAFFANHNLEDILIDVVNRGGDADTTGAIAGMLAGTYYGLDAIPKRWLRALNSDVRAACEKQAIALIDKRSAV